MEIQRAISVERGFLEDDERAGSRQEQQPRGDCHGDLVANEALKQARDERPEKRGEDDDEL